MSSFAKIKASSDFQFLEVISGIFLARHCLRKFITSVPSHPTASLRYLVILGWGAPDRIQTIEGEEVHGLKQTARQPEHYVQISKTCRPPLSDTDRGTNTYKRWGIVQKCSTEYPNHTRQLSVLFAAESS